MKRGCLDCTNLKCTKEPFLEFICMADTERKITNAGACFTIEDKGKHYVITDCKNFTLNHNKMKIKPNKKEYALPNIEGSGFRITTNDDVFHIMIHNGEIILFVPNADQSKLEFEIMSNK